MHPCSARKITYGKDGFMRSKEDESTLKSGKKNNFFELPNSFIIEEFLLFGHRLTKQSVLHNFSKNGFYLVI